MSNKNKPAYPVQTGFGVVSNGLTKRELIAAMAMQGMLSNPQTALQSTDILKNLSLSSTKVADAILEALND